MQGQKYISKYLIFKIGFLSLLQATFAAKGKNVLFFEISPVHIKNRPWLTKII